MPIRALRSLLVPFVLVAACGGETQPPPVETSKVPVELPKPQGPDAGLLATKAGDVFKPLPTWMTADGSPPPRELVDLGRMLYFEKRVSKNHDIACNSCHKVTQFGVDGEPTSPGHKGQRGARNSPTSFNAALHATQFWDGRAPDVEAQAKGPVLNPVEMAMPAEADVLKVLKSISGYADAFKAAFPEEKDPITYDNFAKAVGAFERGFVTPSAFDKFLGGDLTALTTQQMEGLQTFMDVGCTTCHSGVALGGQGFFKLGQVEPYETTDVGRAQVTGNDAEKNFFKPPGLRNVTKTGPYFHDGSITDLAQGVKLMGKHQLGKNLTDDQVNQIIAFLDALTGEIDLAYVAEPTLPESGPKTPAADPG